MTASCFLAARWQHHIGCGRGMTPDAPAQAPALKPSNETPNPATRTLDIVPLSTGATVFLVIRQAHKRRENPARLAQRSG